MNSARDGAVDLRFEFLALVYCIYLGDGRDTCQEFQYMLPNVAQSDEKNAAQLAHQLTEARDGYL
jgi:hypothetical protein